MTDELSISDSSTDLEPTAPADAWKAASSDAERVRRLRAGFARTVLAERPKSVLDVGCGAGVTLAALQRAGVPAVGTEFGVAAASAARSRGFHVVSAPAHALPFREGRFDLVVMRHVPHHLADPAAGLREALRVARRAVVVAEPWFDRRLACQRLGDEFEEWTKRFDRRAGRIHSRRLDAAALVAALGSRVEGVRVHYQLELQRAAAADLALAGQEALDSANRSTVAEHRQLQEFVSSARSSGWSKNGSVIVVARVPS